MLGAGWLQEYKVGLLEAFLCVLQVFWVVHFRGDSAEFLVELSLRWAPQGHLGFQGEIRGGSCHLFLIYFPVETSFSFILQLKTSFSFIPLLHCLVKYINALFYDSIIAVSKSSTRQGFLQQAGEYQIFLEKIKGIKM